MTQLTAEEVVRRIDTTREAECFRNPDRPQARVVRRSTSRQPVEVVRAQTRLRTASYRVRMDADREATTAQIGIAMVVALSTADHVSAADSELLKRAIADLHARGFDICKVRDTMRRIRCAHRQPLDS